MFPCLLNVRHPGSYTQMLDSAFSGKGVLRVLVIASYEQTQRPRQRLTSHPIKCVLLFSLNLMHLS